MQTLFSSKSEGMSVAVTTAALSAQPLPPAKSCQTIRIVSLSTNTVAAFVSIGSDAVVAAVPTTTPTRQGCIILPGSDNTFRIQPDQDTHISTICASGTATLYVYVGEGM